MTRCKRGSAWLLLLLLVNTSLGAVGPVVRAAPDIPPVWPIVDEDFERGTLAPWRQNGSGIIELLPGGGLNGSTGLSVQVDTAPNYLYQTRLARAEEGYLTFWFNPHDVSIPDEGTAWIPGKSIRVAAVTGSTWAPPMVALYVRSPIGASYEAYLAWPTGGGDMHYDYDSAFGLVNGWQKITIGFRKSEWVAAWVNGVLQRQATTVTHDDPYAEIVQVGKTAGSMNVPSGTMRFDEVVFAVPRVDDLWVDAANGSDGNDGLTPGTAFQTISRASDFAGPGTVVHILPGIYRETVRPALSGSAAESAHYLAEEGPGTVFLRGSEPSSALVWTRLVNDPIGLPPNVDPTQIFWADLSSWGLQSPPRFVVELDDQGEVKARLPLAREPDWEVDKEWKHHEFWWAADGGSAAAGCDPATNADSDCDLPWRSLTQLTDRTNDAPPDVIEPGNLTTLGNLVGATLVAIDTVQGHYVFRRTITDHNVQAGRVTVGRICEHDPGTGNPGLGWGSKYFLEGHPALLDEPGEWWYDANDAKLYLWPPAGGNPAVLQLEISQRDNGFELQDRSYVTLDGLTVQFLNGNAVDLVNYPEHKSYGNRVRNATLSYANEGVSLRQSVDDDAPSGNVIDGFVLEDSEVGHMDTDAFRVAYWWEPGTDPDSFTRSGIVNTVIRNNELHHLGFRSDGDSGIGAAIHFANRFRFEGNHVHDVAHNGIQLLESVIQSPKEYGFDPDEIKTGEILIKDNVFEQACQMNTDCGALKIWGTGPDNHVFRDVLITGNIFRDTFAWSYVAEKRGLWTDSEGSEVRGMGAFGLYADHASGLHVYRNIAYNVAYAAFNFHGSWRDGEMVFYNNVAANSFYGFKLGAPSYDTHACVETQLVNNIVVNNEGYGIDLHDMDGQFDNIVIDHNDYYKNGWRSPDEGGLHKPGAMHVLVIPSNGQAYQTVAEIQANTPWEHNGVEGDPVLRVYDPDDHEFHDGSWPDFHLTSGSTLVIDQGTAELPPSLAVLLVAFGVDDVRRGDAFDIGRYEQGFAVHALPMVQAVDPGGVARYTLEIRPSDILERVILTASSPSPSLTVTLNPAVVVPATGVLPTLTVTDTHPGPTLMPGLWFAIPVRGAAEGFSDTVTVRLLVGGARVFLPLLWKE